MLNIQKVLMALIMILASVSAVAAERADPVKIYEKGVEAFEKGDYARAVKFLNDAIKGDLQEPELSDAQNLITCAPTNGPATKTWSAFIAALKKGDYPGAYKLLSSSQKRKINFEKFQYEAKRSGAEEYSGNPRVKPGREERINQTTILLHFCKESTPKGKTLKMTLENGSWRFAE